jgi:dynein heavy chain
LKTSIVSFIDNQFDRIYNTQRALYMIKRFEKLSLPNLGMQEKYIRILSHYSKDIEAVSKIYQKYRQDPAIARDLPPIAGKILWARQLYRRIQQPMNVFVKNNTILQYQEAKKIIKNYNHMSSILMEYEMLHHRAWLRQVELILSGLNASLLIRHPETQEFLVNFDPDIFVLIKETDCMKRLNLFVPNEAEELILRQDELKHNFASIKVCQLTKKPPNYVFRLVNRI